MRIHNYFRRSHSKPQSSKTSFPSFSSSAATTSEDKKEEKVKGSGKRNKRRPSWWKRSSSRIRPNLGEATAKKPSQTRRENSAQNKGTGKENDNRDNPHDRTASGDHQPIPPPPEPQPQLPLSPLAPPDLPQALRYFEITALESFTREFVKKKYKRLSLIHHPDRNRNEQGSIQEMQTINHYFEVLEEELNRLEEETQNTKEKVNEREDEPPVSPPSSSRGSSSGSGSENSNDTHEMPKKDAHTQRQTHTSRRRRGRSVLRRRNHSRRQERKPVRKPNSHTHPHSNTHSQSPRMRRTRHNSKAEHNRYHKPNKAPSTEDGDEIHSRRGVNDFRKQQRRLKRKNTRRSVQEQLETAWGRDRAHDVYTRQVQAYRDKIDSRNRHCGGASCFFSEFTVDGKIELSIKPKHALMECCNEDVVVAMRLGQTQMAMEMLQQEIHRAVQEWIGARVFESFVVHPTKVRLDQSCHQRILRVLTRPLDGDGNTLFHYAVYLEDHEMISQLACIARKYKSFSRFVMCTNDRHQTACDFAKGFQWDNCTVPTLVRSLTHEARELLEKEQRSRPSTSVHPMRKLCLDDYPWAEILLDVGLSFLVGRYVTHCGWVASAAIIALAHFAGAEERNSRAAAATAAAAVTVTVTTPTILTATRMSKTLFFALSTGWYLLGGILWRSKSIFSEGIPVPWQLQLVVLASTTPLFLEGKAKMPLVCLGNAIVGMESALIAFFDWMLSQNDVSVWVAKSNSVSVFGRSTSIPIPMLQTVADFAVLSIPFFAAQLLRGAL